MYIYSTMHAYNVNINLHVRILKYAYVHVRLVHHALYYSMYASILYVKCTASMQCINTYKAEFSVVL